MDNVKTLEPVEQHADSAKSEAVRKAAGRLIPGSTTGTEQQPRKDPGSPQDVGVPPVIAKGKGAMLVDVDGSQYIDYVCENGALLLGHGDERIVAAVHKAASKGWGFPSLTEASVRLAELIAGRFPAIDMVRLVNSRVEAVAGATRVARARTGRDRIVLVEGSLGDDLENLSAALESTPSPLVIPYNDPEAVRSVFQENRSSIAGVIVDPVATRLGLIQPSEGFLKALRRICDEFDAVLIFDESITGFRVAPGGAATHFDVMPDLTCLGPALGGGLPLGAYGGRRELMKLIPSAWGVDQAIGASAANALAIAAGIATLEALGEPGFYDDLEEKSARLEEGLRTACKAADIVADHTRLGSLLGMSFTPRPARGKTPPSKSETSSGAHASIWTKYYQAMLNRGVFLPPTPSVCMCVTAAHTDEQIDQTVQTAREVLPALHTDHDE